MNYSIAFYPDSMIYNQNKTVITVSLLMIKAITLFLLQVPWWVKVTNVSDLENRSTIADWVLNQYHQVVPMGRLYITHLQRDRQGNNNRRGVSTGLRGTVFVSGLR